MTASPPELAAHTAPLAIEAQSLSLGYGRAVVLSRTNLVVPEGALAAVVGPAGGGKSTLLRCLFGRLAVRAGWVRVLGEDPARARVRTGYVPQQDSVPRQIGSGPGTGPLVVAPQGCAMHWPPEQKNLSDAQGAPQGHAAMCGVNLRTYLKELPGMSAFILQDGEVFHAYSAYARGLDGLWGMYQWLDRAPLGRNEDGPWWKRRDEYGAL